MQTQKPSQFEQHLHMLEVGCWRIQVNFLRQTESRCLRKCAFRENVGKQKAAHDKCLVTDVHPRKTWQGLTENGRCAICAHPVVRNHASEDSNSLCNIINVPDRIHHVLISLPWLALFVGHWMSLEFREALPAETENRAAHSAVGLLHVRATAA
jgi:hypothetical protein